MQTSTALIELLDRRYGLVADIILDNVPDVDIPRFDRVCGRRAVSAPGGACRARDHASFGGNARRRRHPIATHIVQVQQVVKTERIYFLIFAGVDPDFQDFPAVVLSDVLF